MSNWGCVSMRSVSTVFGAQGYESNVMIGSSKHEDDYLTIGNHSRREFIIRTGSTCGRACGAAIQAIEL